MTRESAIGDGGRSHGMFQINEDYHLERTWIMGREYDPHDVYDAAVLTGMLIEELHLIAAEYNIILKEV